MRATIAAVCRSVVVPDVAPGGTGTPAALPAAVPLEARARVRRRGRWRPLLVALGAYLALSVVVWWNVWTAHPTSVTTCGCGDQSLFIWFLEWPAYALAHGHNPLFSTAMFHPGGTNLLDNTSVLAIGTLLAPVTWVFGPVATLNLASTLAPALSALAMFWLLRRWVSWTPAAFVGGLLYGFSPFVLSALAGAQLMDGVLVVPPLIIGCLDELLVRQRRRPMAVGAVLGLLVVMQFFIGTEMLAMVVITTAVGVVLVVAHAARRDFADLRRRASHAGVGLATGVALAGVLLAYPVWFFLDGRAHLTGLIWPTTVPGFLGSTLAAYWRLTFDSTAVAGWHRGGGYQGTALPNVAYLGIGLLVVLAAGMVTWFRDRRLWLFGLVGAASMALAYPIVKQYWVPWRVLAQVPVVKNIIPGRFAAMTFLCAAVLLGLVIDDAHRAVARRARRIGAGGRHGLARSVARSVARWAPSAGGLVLALVALIPLYTSFEANIPFTTEPVVLPRWYVEVAPHLPRGQVVLAIPAAFSGLQSAMDWQAIDGMHFAIPDGGGPQGTAARAGKERRGFNAIAAASITFGAPPAVTSATVDAVRHALTAWGVTIVVIPDQPELPVYEQGNHVSYAVALFTAALGRRPHYQADAWVWSGVHTSPTPSVPIASDVFDACVGSRNYPSGPPDAVPTCVLARSTP